MATAKRKPKSKPKQKQPTANEVEFSIKAGSKATITIEAGEEKNGEIPVRIRLGAEGKASGSLTQLEVKKEAGGIQKFFQSPFIKKYSLATWLFFGAIFIYLLTRLIGLSQFPIYFFVDEALQSQFAEDLVKYSFRDAYGIWFPPAFRNNEYFTLGMGVYLQVLPYLIFGKSAIITRATSAIISVIAAISVGLILRDAVKSKYWWAGVLFLSITPTWFLHSRTAWEMTEFTAFYAGALWAYTFYRIKSPNYLYLAILFGALGFYTYSPGQVLVPFTAFALFIFDLKYHWQNRRTVLFGILLLALLGIQYFRFRALDPDNAVAHLQNLGSYLFANISVWEKVKIYFSQYFYGLSPWYWYAPNLSEIPRHVMKGYGQIMLWTLPFALFGLIETIRRMREPVFRIILTGFLATPVATAFVAVGISRTMCFVAIAAILTAIGFEKFLAWIENPSQALNSWLQISTSRVKVLLAINIFIFTSIFALTLEKALDKVVIIFIAFIFALQVSGLVGTIAQRITNSNINKKIKTWNISSVLISWIVFLALCGVNIFMLIDALKNGPTWFKDYNLHGMQYGAFQVFEPVKQYVKEHPSTQVFFSPSWTNGADIIVRFFLGDDTPIKFHSIVGYIENNLPIPEDSLFVMTKEEYNFAVQSEKLADFQIEKTILCPDGTNCFYFVRLRYSDIAEELFAQEKAIRGQLQESTIKINGEDIKVRHTYLEANDQSLNMQLVFDGNPYTNAKTYEANPFVIELTFPSPRTINGFSIVIGSAKVRITLIGYAFPGADPITYQFEGQGAFESPELSFDFPEPMTVQILHIEQLDMYASEPTKNHIWEITFR
jgi:4-amino-4-deoxy-L-arabinose transferase-like glycosyltransferase